MAEENTEKRIEIYQGAEGEVVFDVDAEGETIWATQAQMAKLFGVAPQNITYHIKNVYKEGELEENPIINKKLMGNKGACSKMELSIPGTGR